MDHSENDKRFCVYVHKDQEGNIRYIGSGSIERMYKKVNRSQQHLAEWDSLTKEVVKDGLTKEQSLILEQEYLNKYSDESLLNRTKTVTIPKDISFDIVSKYLEYDENSPTFVRWKFTHRVGRYLRVCGKPAGYLSNSKGYMYVSISGRRYPIHRLVYVLCTEQNLSKNKIIDHIDHNGFNNRIDNLREVTPKENSSNLSLRKDSKTGVNGVTRKGNTGYSVCWSDNFTTKTLLFPFYKFGQSLSEDTMAKCFNMATKYRDLKLRYHGFNDDSKEIIDSIFEIEKYLEENKILFTNTSGENNVSWNSQLMKWYVTWTENKKQKSKCFNPKTLFPELPFDEAKCKSFELAVEFRNRIFKWNAA